MSRGGSGSTFDQEREEVDFLKKSIFRVFDKPQASSVKVRGRKHSVILDEERGRVFKYLTEIALVPIVAEGKLSVRKALPSEYLERLVLMNEFFLDDVKIEGILPNGNFVTSQALLKGGEPTESEISKFLQALGWKRLPNNLMATAWVHGLGELVMVDARPPNFKKTNSGEVLAIDLMLIKATGPLLSFIKNL